MLDRDINEDLALLYPELYKVRVFVLLRCERSSTAAQELTKGRSLSYKTFFEWVMISVYQGGAIMLLSLLLFSSEFINIVAISFTALVLNELAMVRWLPFLRVIRS